MIQNHTHRTSADLRRKLVCRLACHGSILSRVGASGKPGGVHFAFVAIIVLAFPYVSNTPNQSTSQALIGALLISALGTVAITLGVVVAARLYEWIGERVKGNG
jgi:hypothetical protein